MIRHTKNRLTLLFSIAVFGINLLILLVSYYYLHQSILQGLKQALSKDGQNELVEYYNEHSLAEFAQVDEDEVMRIYDSSGSLIVQTVNSQNFNFSPNPVLLRAAFLGQSNFESLEVEGVLHLVLYIPISQAHAGLIAEPILQLSQYEENFRFLVMISLPAVIFLSYLISSWLVNLAMRPITLAFRYQENFSSNVTHELHSPLTSLKGNLEVGLRRERSIEEYQDILHLGLLESNRIITLLQDLQLIASSNFTPLSLQCEEVDLSAMITEVVADFEVLIQEKRIVLVQHCPKNLLGELDEVLIHRVLLNVMSNAVKYTPEGGKIQIWGARQGKGITLIFSNTAQPLKEEEVEHLFDPFFRGSNVGGAKGKGLGLNIARYIIFSHGGKMEASYTQPQEFTLRMQIPLR